MQSTAIIAAILSVAITTFVFIYIAMNVGVRAEYPPIQKRGYKMRKFFIWGLSIIAILVTGITLPGLSFSYVKKGIIPPDAQQIDVTARQWSWTMSTNKILAGKPVVFNVTSEDVNHSFGIYDESLTLLAQVQALPTYRNRLPYTFDEPGKYKIMCLEFCGMAHHAMNSELEVVANPTEL